jgi:hypothetical protein
MIICVLLLAPLSLSQQLIEIINLICKKETNLPRGRTEEISAGQRQSEGASQGRALHGAEGEQRNWSSSRGA